MIPTLEFSQTTGEAGAVTPGFSLAMDKRLQSGYRKVYSAISIIVF